MSKFKINLFFFLFEVTLIKKSALEEKLLFLVDRITKHRIKKIELRSKLQENDGSQSKNKLGMYVLSHISNPILMFSAVSFSFLFPKKASEIEKQILENKNEIRMLRKAHNKVFLGNILIYIKQKLEHVARLLRIYGRRKKNAGSNVLDRPIVEMGRKDLLYHLCL